MQKKLLILNGGHSEIPLIHAGKKLGFHVITTGNISSLIGHQYSDEYYSADFSNKEEVLCLSKKLNIDAICSAANDFSAITAAYVAEKMGLPGHDNFNTSLIIHHKDLFKKFSAEHNIQTPSAIAYSDEQQALSCINKHSLPLIIKPIDLTGGKGISIINSMGEYAEAIRKAFYISREKRIVVEDFFEGTQHSFSPFILNGKVVFYFSDNEYSFLNPFLVSTSSAPASNIDFFSHLLIATAEKIASSLQLVDGILHMQYLANGDTLKIIEITRRCSGDLYPYPVAYACDIDWASWIVRAETGLIGTDFPETTQNGYCGRHCIMSQKNGIINNVIIDESIKDNIFDQLIWWKKGDVIDNYMTQKLGIVMLQFSSAEEMENKIKHINKLIQVTLEP